MLNILFIFEHHVKNGGWGNYRTEINYFYQTLNKQHRIKHNTIYVQVKSVCIYDKQTKIIKEDVKLQKCELNCVCFKCPVMTLVKGQFLHFCLV